jgi:hypothetical protein
VSTQPDISIIRKIKKAHENITIVTGVTIGMILLAYFFTFAQLVDTGYNGLVLFETVSSVVLVIALIFLRQLSFFLVKLLYGHQSVYKSFLAAVTASDLGKDEITLLERFGS